MNDLNENFEVMWTQMMKNLDEDIKKYQDKGLIKVLKAIRKRNKNIQEISLSQQGTWMTTKDVCKQFNVTRQNLHQSKLQPKKVSDRRSLWSTFEVKIWRRELTEKELRIKTRKAKVEQKMLDQERELHGN